MLAKLKEKLDTWRAKRQQKRELELEEKAESQKDVREETRTSEPPWTNLPPPGEGGGIW